MNLFEHLELEFVNMYSPSPPSHGQKCVIRDNNNKEIVASYDATLFNGNGGFMSESTIGYTYRAWKEYLI